MSQLSNAIEPRTRAFLDAVNSKGGPQLYELSVKDARGVLSSVQAMEVTKLPADIEDRDIPGGPSGRVSVRIVRPKGKKELLPDVEARKQPTASPLRASIDQLKGLPPALVINGEFDVLRDEGEAYAHKLIEAGVQVTAVRYLGTIHDFVMLNPITDTPAPRAAIAQANETLRRFFTR